MQKLIKEEINRIQNLEERVVFKELLNNVFLALHEKNEEMYQQLEERVFHESAYESHQYAVFTSLIEKKYFDASHHIFVPMLEEDATELTYSPEAIVKLLKEQPQPIMKVFLECDYLKIKELFEQDEAFEGYIKTDKGMLRASFRLKQNVRYIDQIHHLYQLFVQNGVPWRTILNPYAFKMADVYLEEINGTLKGSTAIKEISVDFGVYSKYIKYDVIPVWNVARSSVQTLGFPIPGEDHKNYEHTIAKDEMNGNGPCLIEDPRFEIQNIEDQGDYIVLISSTDDVEEWNIYQIRENVSRRTDSFAYPVLGNQTKNNFAEKLYDRNKVTIRTRAELERFLRNYELEEYLEFDHYEIREPDTKIQDEVYSVNPFIMDEIRHTGDRNRLILYMNAKKKKNYLLRDILSFLISEVQMQFPEYYCEGRI